jgi:hypothetical protein
MIQKVRQGQKKKGQGNYDWPRPGNEVIKGTFPGPVLKLLTKTSVKLPIRKYNANYFKRIC